MSGRRSSSKAARKSAGTRAAAAAAADDDDDIELLQESNRGTGARRGGRKARIVTQQSDDDDDYDPQREAEETPKDDHELDGDDALLAPLPGIPSGKRRSRGYAGPLAKRSRAPTRIQPSHSTQATLQIHGGQHPIVTQDDVNTVDLVISRYEYEAEQLRQRMKGSIITTQGLEALVRLIVRHVLFSHSEKPNVPISRSELTKLVNDNVPNKKTGLSGYAVALARHRLAHVFGLDMAEVVKPTLRDRETQHASNAHAHAGGGEGSKTYVVRSLLPHCLYAAVVADTSSEAERGFLGVVLALLELEGGKMLEEDLWRHLGDLGVHKGVSHPVFGANPGQLIEDYLRRRQLHAERQQGPDGPERLLYIGENALDEIGSDKLKAFVQAELVRNGENDDVAL